MLHLVVLLLAISASVHAEQQPDGVLRQAISLHQKGDLQGAIERYKEYLKENPASVQAHSNLGAALAALGYYEDAISEYTAALKQDPANVGVGLNLALAHYKTGQIALAAEQLTSLHGRVPENRKITLLLADCLLQSGNNPKVIELLKPINEKDPDDLATVYMLGTALVRDNQLNQGQFLIDRILRNGDSAEARLLLGTTKLQRMDYAGALEDLKRAVDLNPKLPSVYGFYGQSLMATGDTAGAAVAFRKELEENPNDFTANLSLASLLRQDQDYDGALKLLERALRVRPRDPGALYQVAAIHVSQGKVEEARRELESLVGDHANFTEAHVTLATVYYRLKRKEDGDRERAIVQRLNAEAQERQPGVKPVAPESSK
jgi:tetratricopeptide (TPR) repeat protein